MHIKIYGTGCSTCKTLYETTKQAVHELRLEADVEYITDIQKMVEIGLMQSPALVINDYVAHVGSAPEIGKIKELLSDCKSEDVQTTPGKTCCCGGKC